MAYNSTSTRSDGQIVNWRRAKRNIRLTTVKMRGYNHVQLRAALREHWKSHYCTNPVEVRRIANWL